MESLEASDWNAYKATIADPNDNPDRSFGDYAVRTRKRSRTGCPLHNTAG
jgi:hypothetical protein